MGAASTEIEFHLRGRNSHLAVTSARLELARGRAGTVLAVMQDTWFPQLLRACRRTAQQRRHHEIETPPPSLFVCERIGRRIIAPAQTRRHHCKCGRILQANCTLSTVFALLFCSRAAQARHRS